MSQTVRMSIDSVNNLRTAALTLIETDGIEAAEKKYLGASMDRKTRQLAREIFSNLEQNREGKWSFGKPYTGTIKQT